MSENNVINIRKDKENGNKWVIMMHPKFHFDEILAAWILVVYGDEKYPGIGEAKVAYHGKGATLPNGNTPDDFEKENVILVGVGSSKLDDHSPDALRGEKECAATLVAKDLGVENEPELELMLKEALRFDNKAVGGLFDLPSVIKKLHASYPDNPDKVFDWSVVAIEAIFDEQQKFMSSTAKEFADKAEIEQVMGPKGTVKMVTIESDDPLINRYARSTHGGKAAIIVQKNSSGCVQIYTNRKNSLVLYDVAQMIRLREQEKKGQIILADWKKLSTEGSLPEIPEWFFHHEGQMLLNGSLSAPDVNPTQLSLDEIKGLVRIGINPRLFETNHRLNCSSGICTSSIDDPCAWYSYGLNRCRKLRFLSYKRK